MNIQGFEQDFKNVFPGKRLLAVKLDGFSHSAWYDGGTTESGVEQVWFSGCAPESPHNTPESKRLLGKYPHYCYQSNSYSHMWVAPDNR
jgi:hypothetical protein